MRPRRRLRVESYGYEPKLISLSAALLDKLRGSLVRIKFNSPRLEQDGERSRIVTDFQATLAAPISPGSL